MWVKRQGDSIRTADLESQNISLPPPPSFDSYSRRERARYDRFGNPDLERAGGKAPRGGGWDDAKFMRGSCARYVRRVEAAAERGVGGTKASAGQIVIGVAISL